MPSHPLPHATLDASHSHRSGWQQMTDKLVAPLLYLAIIVTLLGTFLADVQTPLGVAVWVLYMLPLILSLWLWQPIVPVLVAISATCFMIINFYTDPDGMARDIAQLNRGMGIFSIWAMAIVGHFFIRSRLAVRREEWLQRGVTSLNIAMSGEQKIGELAHHVLSFLVDYTEAKAAAIYALDSGAYRLAGTHGVAALGALPEFTADDGLLGQALVEKRVQQWHDVPEDYLVVGTAFARGKPRHLLIVPATADEGVQAVIELGYMARYDDVVLELLERAQSTIGVAFRSAHYRTNLQNLLEETQRQSEELQAQSEELRVANEELEEQSRVLHESQSRLEQQQAELEQTNSQLEEQSQQLEMQRDDLARATAVLELKTRELEEASQYKSDFLANMSHELRTPLNSSLILAKLLADNPEGNLSDEQVRYAQTIQAAGNDLLGLINDVLDLSKIEAGHMEMRPEKLQLSKFTDALGRMFEPLAKQKQLTLTVELGDACPKTIETDGKRLEQVLKNLLSNAIKFTETGEVKLTISRVPDGRIAFAVSDTGIGIPTAQHDVVFEAFRQADGTTNRKYGGTGLGLSISRELTRLLGGDITLTSAPGEGSVFTVYLPVKYKPESVRSRGEKTHPRVPLASPPAKPNAKIKAKTEKQTPAAAKALAKTAPRPAEPSLADDREQLIQGKQVILVVEDDISFAEILYQLAQEQGFQCLIAHTAEEALALAQEYLPHAVILDVGLPDHSGLSVLDRLKHDTRTRHIPVHVVSAEDYSHTAYSLGAVGYMLKPVKREQLVGALDQLEHRLVQRMRRVLVVEDDEVQRESVRKLLGSHEVETVGVGTAAECLARLKNETYDCMVLDLSLPDASGYALLETLSEGEDYSFPPVIVYTGRDLTSEQEQQLRRYSKSIIIKGAKSPERLLDEVTLFLHQVVSDLPDEQQKMLKKAQNRDAVLEGRRILVVEDDIRNVYALTSIFEPRGAQVQIARNGREALEILEKSQGNGAQAMDLVLMDVMMPEMDGLTATREIRKRSEWRKLPVLMLTAKAMPDDQERCLAAGANDYMAKPLDVEKLLSLVRVWMPR